MPSRYSKYYDEWVELYMNGLGSPDIAKKYGCSDTTIRNIIRKFGVIRTRSEVSAIIHSNRHKDHDSYFDYIDTEEKSYFLGLLLSDGCISVPKEGGQQTVAINMQIDDGYIVEQLAIALCRNVCYKPSKPGHKAVVTMSATSNHIVNTLRGYGFTERKSTDDHDAIGFKYIHNTLMPHFIRGIIDGDGWIFWGNGNNPHIGCCGNFNDMNSLSLALSSIGCKYKPPKIKGCIYVVNWCSFSDVTKILNYIYDNATVYLRRKKNNADQIIDRIVTRKIEKENYNSRILEDYITDGSTRKLAKKYGCCAEKVRLIVRNAGKSRTRKYALMKRRMGSKEA